MVVVIQKKTSKIINLRESSKMNRTMELIGEDFAKKHLDHRWLRIHW